MNFLKINFHWSVVDLNVVLVSAIAQSESVIHIHISVFFKILFPSRLLQSIERSFLSCTGGSS